MFENASVSTIMIYSIVLYLEGGSYMSKDVFNNSQTISTGEWIVTYLLMCIPVVDIILLFVWALSSNTKESKSNWAKSMLILLFLSVIAAVMLYAAGMLNTGLIPVS